MRLLEHENPRCTESASIFRDKDVRRIGSSIAFFHERALTQDATWWSFEEPNYDEIGGLLPLMPSWRNMMAAEAESEGGETARYKVRRVFGELPETIDILNRIAAPSAPTCR